MESRWARLALEALIVVVVFAAVDGMFLLVSFQVAGAFSAFAFGVGLSVLRQLRKRWPPLDDERRQARLS